MNNIVEKPPQCEHNEIVSFITPRELTPTSHCTKWFSFYLYLVLHWYTQHISSVSKFRNSQSPIQIHSGMNTHDTHTCPRAYNSAGCKPSHMKCKLRISTLDADYVYKVPLQSVNKLDVVATQTLWHRPTNHMVTPISPLQTSLTGDIIMVYLDAFRDQQRPT